MYRQLVLGKFLVLPTCDDVRVLHYKFPSGSKNTNILTLGPKSCKSYPFWAIGFPGFWGPAPPVQALGPDRQFPSSPLRLLSHSVFWGVVQVVGGNMRFLKISYQNGGPDSDETTGWLWALAALFRPPTHPRIHPTHPQPPNQHINRNPNSL